MNVRRRLIVRLATACLLYACSASAATLRDGFAETTIAAGLASPTTMAFAPDGRLFVAEQGGTLRVIKDGVLLPEPFLTLDVSPYGERGLLGITFDPAFTSNHFVYVYYTAVTPNVHNRVSRFTANGDVADFGSETVVLDLPELDATTHNGGAIHFGLDGMLYVAVGENGQSWSAQDLSTPLGKMLRIRSDGSIPPDNPFRSQTTGINRAIWALGLRNPFTFTFDPFSGRMLINDVGEDTWEEIDEGIAGANYGWPETEGPSDEAGLVNPIYAYGHDGSTCAITGGAIYPVVPSAFPSEFADDYFFADLCAGWIRHYDFADGIDPIDFAAGIAAPVDVVVGPDGSLYYLSRGWIDNTGMVVRIDYTSAATHPPGEPPADPNPPPVVPSPPPVVLGAPPVPTITAPAARALYVAGNTVVFAGSAIDAEDGPLPSSRFTWQVELHHDADVHVLLGPVTGAGAGSFVVPTSGDPSPDVWYRIQLTVTDSSGQQASTFVDIYPKTVSLTLRTTPSGPFLTLDGTPVGASLTFRSVIGMSRTIGASSGEAVRNVAYDFRSWSDGGARTHAITTPSRSVTFTATFRTHKMKPARADEPVRYAVPRQ